MPPRITGLISNILIRGYYRVYPNMYGVLVIIFVGFLRLSWAGDCDDIVAGVGKCQDDMGKFYYQDGSCRDCADICLPGRAFYNDGYCRNNCLKLWCLLNELKTFYNVTEARPTVSPNSPQSTTDFNPFHAHTADATNYKALTFAGWAIALPLLVLFVGMLIVFCIKRCRKKASRRAGHSVAGAAELQNLDGGRNAAQAERNVEQNNAGDAEESMDLQLQEDPTSHEQPVKPLWKRIFRCR